MLSELLIFINNNQGTCNGLAVIFGVMLGCILGNLFWQYQRKREYTPTTVANTELCPYKIEVDIK